MKLVFLVYVRILKLAPDSVLLGSVLEGLAKYDRFINSCKKQGRIDYAGKTTHGHLFHSRFAHLISIDFFDDLFNVLNELVASDVS